MKRIFSRKIIVLLLIPILFSLSACGGGGGGGGVASEPASSEAGPAVGDSSSATPPPVEQAAKVVTIAWDAPTQDDGSPTSGISGYRLRYGTTAGSYATTIDVGASTSCTVNDLTPGTYYFTVTAYDSMGNESEYSNEVIHSIS